MMMSRLRSWLPRQWMHRAITKNVVSDCNDRNRALDVLRGIAIVLVLLRHMPVATAPELAALVKPLKAAGWCGVDLFFVLSGYLISGLLLSDLKKLGRIRLSRFWLRRGLKIWPSYYAVYGLLFVTSVLPPVLAGGLEEASRRAYAAIPNFVFVQNFFPSAVRWPHSWSLAIEEQFYIGLPLIMSVAHRRAADWSAFVRVLMRVVAGICAASFALRAAVYWAGPVDWSHLYYPTQYRLDSLGFGVLVRLQQERLSTDELARLAKALSLAPAALAIVLMLLFTAFPIEQNPGTLVGGLSLLALAFGGLVLQAGAPKSTEGGGRFRLVRQLLIWLGVYSYAIYLMHSVYSVFAWLPVTRLLHTFLVSWLPRVGSTIEYFIISVGGGFLVTRLLERPILEWRARHVR